MMETTHMRDSLTQLHLNAMCSFKPQHIDLLSLQCVDTKYLEKNINTSGFKYPFNVQWSKIKVFIFNLIHTEGQLIIVHLILS